MRDMTKKEKFCQVDTSKYQFEEVYICVFSKKYTLRTRYRIRQRDKNAAISSSLAVERTEEVVGDEKVLGLAVEESLRAVDEVVALEAARQDEHFHGVLRIRVALDERATSLLGDVVLVLFRSV